MILAEGKTECAQTKKEGERERENRMKQLLEGQRKHIRGEGKGEMFKPHTYNRAGLAQSVERLTAEREVAGSIPGVGTILRVLK